MIKRIIDIFASLGALIILIPVMIIVSIAVFVRLGRPLVFRQARTGLCGAEFNIYKFRTMQNISDENGVSLPDAERTTYFGDFLRRMSLDELPSIFNVLLGDISLVGPRPLMAKYYPLYSSAQLRRFEVKPGITGWAQINGRNAISWEEKFELDVWYVDNRTIWLDLEILFVTLFKIFSSKDINQPGHTTMPEFRGSNRD